jgi:6-phosphogluconolactonase (cycloisomerase 2 family)
MSVYVQTNEPRNAVLVFPQGEDGRLGEPTSVETGGAGDGHPHLTSQGSVVLSGDGQYLLVTNAASNDVTAFAVLDDGSLKVLGQTNAGFAPKSVTEHDGLVYALSTKTPAVFGYRLSAGGLEFLPDAEHALLSPDADPAQLGFTPDGTALVVTERGRDMVTAFPINADGTLGEPQSASSSGPTPYGFAFRGDGVLVVTEAFRAEKGAAAVSTYRVDGAALTPLTRSLGNGRSEICWAVVTPDDRFVFTTNFADGAVSAWAFAEDGTVTLADATAGLTVDGRPGLRDAALSADGRHLYAVDADAGAVVAWALGPDGTLSYAGSQDGLPLTIAGLAAG